jgi:hypothetical protein
LSFELSPFPRLACDRGSGSCAAALEMQGRRFCEKVLAHFHGNGAHACKQPFSVALPSVFSAGSSVAGVRHRFRTSNFNFSSTPSSGRRLLFFPFGHSCLFRISDFEFRICFSIPPYSHLITCLAESTRYPSPSRKFIPRSPLYLTSGPWWLITLAWSPSFFTGPTAT